MIAVGRLQIYENGKTTKKDANTTVKDKKKSLFYPMLSSKVWAVWVILLLIIHYIHVEV